MPGFSKFEIRQLQARSTRVVPKDAGQDHSHSGTSGQNSMSGVWSCNEWDQLEEVIVGNPLNARYPTPDRSTQLAEFPDRSLAEIPS